MEQVLEVEDLVKHFSIRTGWIKTSPLHAVDGVSLDLYKGRTLGLVGESGSGKTTVGRCILRLAEPTSGEVSYRGRDILKLSPGEMRRARRQLQMVFQDPEGSLNPRFTCRKILTEPLKRLGIAKGPQLKEKVDDLVRQVGLQPDDMDKFPHQFSGGQQQRIAVARAMATKPEVVILDEPTSALDVSVRAQIVELLVKLQDEFGLAYLLISHDLSIVKYLSDTVAVMYLGQMVEMSSSHDLFASPLHPYTQALIASVPIPDPEARREKIVLEGEIPSPVNPPSGCRFHTRCPKAMPLCSAQTPEVVASGDHFVACHLFRGA